MWKNVTYWEVETFMYFYNIVTGYLCFSAHTIFWFFSYTICQQTFLVELAMLKTYTYIYFLNSSLVIGLFS
jgi:hypothetical protein